MAVQCRQSDELFFFLAATKEEGTKQALVFIARMSVEIDERLDYLVK
jgi:hypothetical protein